MEIFFSDFVSSYIIRDRVFGRCNVVSRPPHFCLFKFALKDLDERKSVNKKSPYKMTKFVFSEKKGKPLVLQVAKKMSLSNLVF